MKPRTKLEHRVTRLSELILPITKKQIKYASTNYLDHLGYANKSRAFCLDCGEEFDLEIIHRKRVVCPTCNTKLKIENTRKYTHFQREYFAIADVVEEFQVLRYFEITSNHRINEIATIVCREILQHWIDPNLKLTMIGMNHHTQGYCDSWTGGWEIRKAPRSYYSHSKYDVYVDYYHPDSVFKADYAKYGIDYRLNGITFLEAVRLIPNDSKAETLLKAKQYSLLSHFERNSGSVYTYWSSIKICFRNKYKVKDASMWIDYLDLLRHFGKDLRNAKYVCPKNLRKEHNRLVEKKKRIDERLEQERQLKDLQRSEKRYRQDKARFFGLCFSSGDLTIKVLESVNEFKEEATELNHCLFANRYFSKEDSLIFSAKLQGKRIATIEIDLNELKISQVRGYDNQISDYDAMIRRLLKQNLDKIVNHKQVA